jgi:hypothetical protein
MSFLQAGSETPVVCGATSNPALNSRPDHTIWGDQG